LLGIHKLANGDLACSELGWRPAQARVQIQQFAYICQLMHETPARTRALHRELAAAPPLTAGYAVDRACAVVQFGAADMEAVLGACAMERCGSMGKSKWTEWAQSAVDVHYRRHWIRRIEAKLAKPLAEAAAPEVLVGHVVHKLAAAFGRGGGGGRAGWLGDRIQCRPVDLECRVRRRGAPGPRGAWGVGHAPVRPRG
jgi:hypothetical protein